MNGNCYTYPFILPNVPLKSPLATSLNCLEYALVHDAAFIETCDTAIVHTISQHKKAALKELDAGLALLQPPVDIN